MSKLAIATQLVGAIGSLFVQTGEKGVEVAIVPFLLAAGLLVSSACLVQDDEPFSQCVKAVWSTFIPSFKEVK